MKQFFITGTSSGIGKALAERALENGDTVTGISRRHIIQHADFRHISCDLSRPDQYLKINFNINKEAEALVLINNAGWLGEVKPLSRQNPDNIKKAYDINLIAPAVLSKMFIEQNQDGKQKLIIINISSGAANYPVGSWSTYCSSKAGLNMLTLVTKEDHPDVSCMAISPGIVDTSMQGEIRSLEKKDFPDRGRFDEYKKEGQLTDPAEVARKILHFAENPHTIPATVFSLRDVS